MKYEVTNNGEARTVDFLAVFAEGETKEFTHAELAAYQAMIGVPVVSALPEEFDIVFISETEGEGK